MKFHTPGGEGGQNPKCEKIHTFIIFSISLIQILLTPFLSSFWCQWSYDPLVPLQREAQQRQHGGAYRQVTAGHEERQS